MAMTESEQRPRAWAGPGVNRSCRRARVPAGRLRGPRWTAETPRCLGCGACAYICPTCHCFDIVDEGSAAGGVRVRNWDACQFAMFTAHASGHNPRGAQSQRQRQRVFHKFQIYPRNSATSSAPAAATARGAVRRAWASARARGDRANPVPTHAPTRPMKQIHLPTRPDGSARRPAADGRREVGATPLPRRGPGRRIFPSASGNFGMFSVFGRGRIDVQHLLQLELDRLYRVLFPPHRPRDRGPVDRRQGRHDRLSRALRQRLSDGEVAGAGT